MEAVICCPTDASAGIGDVKPVPKCRSTERHFPVFVGGIAVVSEGDHASSGIDRVLDKRINPTWISIGFRDILHKNDIPLARSNFLGSFENRFPFHKHPTPTLAKFPNFHGSV